MSKTAHADMQEGQDVFDRFRKAIVAVPKRVVTADQKRKVEKKRAAKP